MGEETAVQVRNASFRYYDDSAPVLTDVSLSVSRSEWLAVTGHNGSGKSTLARLMNGLLLPQKGDVLIRSLNTKSQADTAAIRKTVGMVFQNPDNQIVAPTVQDDVAFGLENNGVPADEMEERVASAIVQAGLTGFEEEEPHNLSGGQKQRVAIAGVLALRPDIIILDEATSMLDPSGKKEVLELTARLRETEKVTVISITHDLEEVFYADRMIVMKDGVITAEGIPKDVFQNRAVLDQAGLEQPFSVQLRAELESQGVALSEDAVTEKAMVEALCTLKRKT
ncbi:energy-coupling factor transporter ATPase [Alteribacter lacisalsi]|uniref:Energy-coupling factor transporter ATPase n=1 Tax=Alteribacter lacisalsi TaxID=2045244 RepID=A0A2W0H346_9BACI|nr:energy-coupling factor transporter ATPase [Alteribacter lacisalsi]PYZ95627.1 energy-coupling factor transporter ATPase [Alteribacter lacisalsi]